MRNASHFLYPLVEKQFNNVFYKEIEGAALVKVKDMKSKLKLIGAFIVLIAAVSIFVIQSIVVAAVIGILGLVILTTGFAIEGISQWRKGPSQKKSKTEPKAKPKGKYCKRCKLELPPEAEFCPKCGRKV
jgi:ribosomal protein L40E